VLVASISTRAFLYIVTASPALFLRGELGSSDYELSIRIVGFLDIIT